MSELQNTIQRVRELEARMTKLEARVGPEVKVNIVLREPCAGIRPENRWYQDEHGYHKAG